MCTIAGLICPTMTGFSGHAIIECSLFVSGLSAVLVPLCGTVWLIASARGQMARAANAKSKLPMVCAVGIGLFLLSLSIVLIANRVAHNAEDHPPLLSRAGLRNLASPLLGIGERVQDKLRLTEFTSLDPIDAHVHISNTDPAFVALLAQLHMRVLDILVVNDRRPYRATLDQQKQDALTFVESSTGLARLCTTFDPFRLNDPTFSQETIAALDQDFAHGAVAVKVWKNLGMEIKNASGQYVMPDDLLLEPIYRAVAAHNKTLIIHAADPDAAWTAQYATPGSARYYAENPAWDMSKKPDAPQKKAILEARDHLLEMNPDLRVIGAHFGSMEAHLDELAYRLDRYPNFAVDTAARIQRLTVQPRDTVRAFFMKYQDRIVYGTDLSFGDESPQTGPATAQPWRQQYMLEWRYLATDDTFDYRGQQVEGLDLPRSVLKKIYHDNAVRWIPGIDGNPN